MVRMWRKVVGLLVIVALSVSLLTGCPWDKEKNRDNENSLSGTVSAAAGTMADSDVNDPFAPRISNDTYQTAQLIANPVVLGGYANEAGTGEPGASSTQGDGSDFYKVYLQAGQQIALVITDEDPQANDLDLYLYRETSPDFYIDSSVNTGSHEFINVLVDGYYFVEVYVWSGATNYILSIGQSTEGAAVLNEQGRLSSQSEFVPGEAIVRFKDDIATFPLAKAQALGMRVKGGGAGRPMLMQLPEQSQARSQVLKSMGVPERHVAASAAMNARQRARHDTLMAIKALRKRKDVLYAEPNYLRRSLATPNDDLYDQQWHYPLINLPQAWDITTGSSAVTVAVVDTGVLLNHPDLQGQLVAGYDFVKDLAYSNDGNGPDSDPNDPGDNPGAGSSFHGTHVAGTIAAGSNNGVGVAGVAWNARIMPLRVLGAGGVGTSYDIMQAIRYAAGLSTDYGIKLDQPVDIINLSLGGPSFSNAERETYDSVYNAGVMVVAAAGNESTSTASYPAAYEKVISVSAVDRNKVLSSYSNYGSTITLAAPGGDSNGGVLSTLGDDRVSPINYTYGALAGTSMAAPHVAGVLALMKAAYPALTPAQLDGLITCGLLTEDIGAAGRDNQFGHGLIDAYKAVNEAQALAVSGSFSCNVPQVSPASLNLGNAGSSAQLEVSRIGNQDMSISAVTDDAAWLAVAPASVDGEGFGSYQVTVDRSQVTGVGTFRATITFTTSLGGQVQVAVLMQRISTSLNDDAGYLYILLLDAQTLETVQQIELSASNGRYSYRFDNLTPGNYNVVAGSDNNNNSYIHEPGEAWGSYLPVEGTGGVAVNGTVSGIDFEAGFDVYFISPPAQQLFRGQGGAQSKQPKIPEMAR